MKNINEWYVYTLDVIFNKPLFCIRIINTSLDIRHVEIPL